MLLVGRLLVLALMLLGSVCASMGMVFSALSDIKHTKVTLACAISCVPAIIMITIVAS